MNWYNKWFGTRYYDLLYNKRDDNEAKRFLDVLMHQINLPHDAKILDVACGKGRHAIYLNKLGFDVTGIDLSYNSIDYGKQFENPKLQFYLHDMRRLFRTNSYDLLLNLFTSFGYFEHKHHNSMAINSWAAALKPKGKLVIDFFNTNKITTQLVPHQKRLIEGIGFEVSKTCEAGYITKTIKVTDDNTEKFFYERVQALTLNDFEKYIAGAGLKIDAIFGDYDLNTFDPQLADRLIIIAEK